MKKRVRNLIRKLILKAKKVSFVGFGGIPIYDVGYFFYNEIKKEDLTLRAYSMAFNFFLALLPGIIFLFSLFAYIPVDNLGEMVLKNLKTFMPDEAFLLIESTILDILIEERGNLLSFSFIITTYFAINGVRCSIASFNKELPTFKHRGILQDFHVAFILVVLLSLMIFTALALMIVGGNVIELIFNLADLQKGIMFYLLEILRWSLIFLSIYFSIALLYRYGVASNKKWSFISVGAICATILCIVSSGLFSYYVNNFSQYNKFYGSLGAIIIIMLWFYFNCLGILIGFELNTSIVENKHKRSSDQSLV
jgi:membrane protein